MGDIAENTAVAKRGYELFMAGNIEEVLKLIDDSCEWVVRGPQDKLPWAGSYPYPARR
jgi:ketosteroid isomerase-like protein